MKARRFAARAGRCRRAGPLEVALTLALPLLAPCPAASQDVSDDEPNRGGTPRFEALDPQYALQQLHPADGYEVSLFASEQDFPIGNPVALTFDSRGRLWVATMPSYPQRLPNEEPDDKIVILEDTDGDGRADSHTVFARGLHLPTGFELGDGGAYVAQQPNLMFIEDTDGDDIADRYEVILHGFGTEDSHHSISAFTWGPGGGLYFQEGTFHHSQVETPYGPVRLVDAGVFRYKPQRFRLEVFVSYPFANPWGHVFDRWGQNFIADASGGANYFGAPITGNAPYPTKRRRMKVFTSIVRPTSGCEIVRSRQFPDEAQGNFLVNNTIGFQGIKQHRVIEEGSGFTSEEVEPLLYSTDINFRPVDLQFGPDGSLYVVDWFNPLIGHMQYSLRDERRDADHGRIWRIRHRDRPLLDPPEIEDAPTPALVRLLESYEDRTRYRVRRELRERPRDEVLAALRDWLDDLHPPADRAALDDPEEIARVERRRLEGLWLYQNLNVVEPVLLERMLRSPEPRARAAATRVARFWRRELDDPLALLARQVEDEFPRTRLEALLGLSYLESEPAARAALRALEQPTDYYLDYTLGETVDTLKPWWQPALEEGDDRTTTLLDELAPAAGNYLLRRLPTTDLESLPAHPLTDRAVLLRADGGLERQRQAIAHLADGNNEAAALLVAELARLDENEATDDETIRRLVAHLLERSPSALSVIRSDLRSLAAAGGRQTVRSGAMAALMVAAGSTAPRTVLGRRPEANQRIDWLGAVDLLPAEIRSEAYPFVSDLFESRFGDERLQVLEAAARTLAGLTNDAGRSFERLAGLVADPELGLAALDGLGRLVEEAPEAWPTNGSEEDLIGPILAALAHAPPRELTSPRFRNIHDLGLRIVDRSSELTDGLRGADLREQLVNAGPAIVRLRPIPHQMLFDLDEFTVRAGAAVEMTFENTDVMPHNVVVTRPGALEEVGRLADSEAEQNPARAQAAGYVPRSPLVLFRTGLVQPGDTEVLRFVAPSEPGLYPFVCTFPGHWILMKGTMRVVERLDGTAATRYAAPRLLPDVPQRAFVADWTYELLETDIRALADEPAGDETGFERGRRLFAEVGCATCHQLGGRGGEIGPALDGLADRYTALEALRHILEPSDEVVDDYRTHLAVTRDGRFYSGLLVAADENAVRIRSNPLDPDHVETIPRNELESIEESALSAMPSGLLSTLQPPEIQDLIRYLLDSP